MIKKTKEVEKLGFQPILRSKYLVILALLGVLAIMSSSFVSHYDLWAVYVTIALVALVVFGLYENVRFQKLHHVLRPYIVMRVMQVIVTLGFLVLVFRTYEAAMEAPVPYLVYYLLGLTALYQFYSLFKLAKAAKKRFPDRCEFC